MAKKLRERPSGRRTLAGHLRSRLLSGVLSLIPLVVTYLVLRFVAGLTSSFLRPIVRLFLGPVHPAIEMVLSLAGVVLAIYLIGLIAAHIVGQRLIALGDSILLRVPLVRNIYSASKRMVDTLRTSSRADFKSVVIVPFPNQLSRSIGFLTGMCADKTGKRICRVFVPTTPNPTSGFFLLVDEAESETVNWSVEDAIKVIMSGGMLAPELLDTASLSQKADGEGAPQEAPASTHGRDQEVPL